MSITKSTEKKIKIKFKKLKFSNNTPYFLLGLILIGTAIATTNYFAWGMSGLTGFFLAYLTKGMRRYRPPR